MKKLMMFFLVFIMVGFTVRAQEVFNEAIKEWKIVTVVESIIPMGIGRSRMIENMAGKIGMQCIDPGFPFLR